MRKTVLAVMMIISAGLFLSAPAANAAGSLPRDEGSGPVDFTLQDLDSNTVSLASYRDKNHVLLIFWTSWCPYCLKGLVDLRAKYPELAKSGIEVLAINAGESHSTAARVAMNYGLKFKVLLDPDEETVGYFQVVGIPLYILLDKKGGVISRGNSYPAAAINKITVK